ncbi:unnamed protein product [Allacma fusca]|uniref:Uncharacterized protein n=1 Tax=Allacma fusca TaxID=39272 RepID=A0A8J2P9L1_9HEXA|nr:unnamed protein product [Allacma fusca]
MGFIQHICFFVLTLTIFSEGATLEEKNHETSSQNNFPTCTFLLLESTFQSDYPKLQINFPSRSNSTSCDIEDHETPGNSTGLHNYTEFVKCAGRTIHFDTDKISQPGLYHRIQINCTSSSPVDFTFGQETPFAGIEVSFGKNTEKSTAPSTWVAATFPSVFGIEHEGLEKYSGDYIFFSPENPTIEVQFSLNISKAQPAKPQVQRMCLKVFENRADCTVSGSSNPSQDLYFANVGGRNPTETQLLQSCLKSPSKPCGNKYRGTHCVQDPHCKKLQPIHQHGLIRCSSGNDTQVVQYLTDLDADTRRVEGNDALKKLPQDAIIRIEKENGISTTEIVFSDNDEVVASNKHDMNGCIAMETVVQPLRLNGSIPLQFLTNEKFKVECHFIPYLLVPPVLWSVEFENGTNQQIFADYGVNITSEKKILHQVNSEDVIVNIQSSHLEIEAVPGMDAITCEAYYWNELKVARSTQAVEIVKEGSIPGPHPAVNATSPSE